MNISTEWIKVLALVALVALNSFDRIRPAPSPDAAPVASGPSLAFPQAGVYVVKVQIGDQLGALVTNVEAPGTYPVTLAAQPR